MREWLWGLIVALTLSSFLGCKENKKDKVPQSVAANFMVKYPSEIDPQWTLNDTGLWVAHFKIEEELYWADFESNGLWIETSIETSLQDTPSAVITALMLDTTIDQIDRIKRVVHFKEGIIYRVHLKDNVINKIISYYPDGTVVD